MKLELGVASRFFEFLLENPSSGSAEWLFFKNIIHAKKGNPVKVPYWNNCDTDVYIERMQKVIDSISKKIIKRKFVYLPDEELVGTLKKLIGLFSNDLEDLPLFLDDERVAPIAVWLLKNI